MNTFGRITVRECVNVPPPPDPRCGDPAFALANPDICPSSPHLVIKPGVALACALGSVQFTAVLITNGIEQDVSADCLWQTSDATIAVIGSTTGSATGLSQGEATVSATYGDFTATSELSVMAASGSSCCSSKSVAMMLLVDTSKSMSQQFGSSYSTLLDFAKAGASRFANEVNETKDQVGLITFNEALVMSEDALTSDTGTVSDDCTTIVQTQQKTEFYDAFVEAIDQLDASAADLKVIVVFSDGEDTGDASANGYVGGNNPIQLLADFKANGGVVICLGCRAAGGGFAFLSALATGGFFVNGYPGSEAAALDYLSGLKGYICAGNCTPTGDFIIGEGELNYDSFVNWDVTGGTVDLLGNGFLDFMPGNGLYVDLSGSGHTAPSLGRLVSKTPFTLTAGHQYRLSCKLAANPVKGGGPYSAKLQVFYLNGTAEVSMMSQSVVVNGASSEFQPYSFTFTAPAAVDAYIAIQEVDIPDSTSPGCDYGMYLDQVTFDDVTDLINLLTDTFDDENQVYVPPACGVATTWFNGAYAVGYNCYGVGCLDEPPPAQLPDPNPLPDIEAGYTPPAIYQSTQTSCASCPVGTKNLPALAATVVTSELGPPQIIAVQLDVAAVVQAFSLDSLTTTNATLSSVIFAGSMDGISWTDLFMTDQISLLVNATQYYPSVDNTTAYLYYRVKAGGVYPNANILASANFTVYGVLDAICNTATETGASQAEADANAIAAALAIGQAQLNCQPFYTATEQVTVACPIGTFGPPVTKSVTRSSFISQQDAEAQATAEATRLAQIDIAADCTQSNNEQSVTISDAPAGGVGFASLFPIVKNVTGETGTITSVSVEINGLTHTWPSDLQMFLMGPDGTCVGIMRHVGNGNSISNVDLVFQDGSPQIGVSDTIASGTYAPSVDGLSSWGFSPTSTPTSPTAPASFSLSDFNGSDPNGSWSLWIIDAGSGNTGTIAGGFDLVFVTA